MLPTLLPSPHKKHPSISGGVTGIERDRKEGRRGFFSPLTFLSREKNLEFGSHVGKSTMPCFLSFPLTTAACQSQKDPKTCFSAPQPKNILHTPPEKKEAGTIRRSRLKNSSRRGLTSVPPPPKKIVDRGLCRKPRRYYTYVQGNWIKLQEVFFMKLYGKVYDVQICIFIGDLATTLPFPSLPFPFFKNAFLSRSYGRREIWGRSFVRFPPFFDGCPRRFVRRNGGPPFRTPLRLSPFSFRHRRRRRRIAKRRFRKDVGKRIRQYFIIKTLTIKDKLIFFASNC